MNPLTELLNKKCKRLLSVYFTAGFPSLQSTNKIILSLQDRGVDFVEAGMPFSDPLADGPVIQQSNNTALRNGMTMEILFDQLDELRGAVRIPVILMGYFNPVLQYGVEAFCKRAGKAGVSGVIIPDLPVQEYKERYQKCFDDYGLHFVSLITPTTSDERIRQIDDQCTSFLYAVSASATTGNQEEIPATVTVKVSKALLMKDEAKTAYEARLKKIKYLKRLQGLKLKHPVVVGFGIHDRETLSDAWENAAGAIIGTAYVKLLMEQGDESLVITRLLRQISV